MKTKLRIYAIELAFVDYTKKYGIQNTYSFKNVEFPRMKKGVLSTSYMKYLQKDGILLCSKKGLEQLMRHRMLVCLKGV